MIPDEHGWYLVKIAQTGQWCMAHVDEDAAHEQCYGGRNE